MGWAPFASTRQGTSMTAPASRTESVEPFRTFRMSVARSSRAMARISARATFS